MSLFARLRRTADPTRRLATIPSRGPAPSARGATSTVKCATCAFLVSAPFWTRSNSGERRRRDDFRKRNSLLLVRGRRQALAALRTAAVDHRASVLRLHARQEAMRALAAELVRLKSALHRRSLLVIPKRRDKKHFDHASVKPDFS